MSEPKSTIPRLSERQIRNFHTRYIKGTVDECWPWNGCTNDKGYGILRSSGRANSEEYKAHRVAYWLHYGRWPTLRILHRCDNRPCVNWNHLYEGTQAENTDDRDTRGRTALGEANGRSKITKETAVGIRAALASGERQAAVARRFNTSFNTVHSIRTRRAWKWLD